MLTAPAAIVLAAGQGTRMRSRIPKVLHPLAGRPLILHVLDALTAAGVERTVVVIGHGADAVEAAIGDRATTARQEPQRGTADAVRVGLEALGADAEGVVLVTMGDAPLQPAALFVRLLAEQGAGGTPLALVSARMDDPSGYGRIVRGPDGGAAAIVEEADADEATLALSEVNAGTYAFEIAWLREAIGRVQASASRRTGTPPVPRGVRPSAPPAGRRPDAPSWRSRPPRSSARRGPPVPGGSPARGRPRESWYCS